MQQVKVVIAKRPHPIHDGKIILHAFFKYNGQRFDPTPYPDPYLHEYLPIFEYNDDPKSKYMMKTWILH